jgi:multidrug efflux pump subunit AcrA (membrane-fusion protein)
MLPGAARPAAFAIAIAILVGGCGGPAPGDEETGEGAVAATMAVTAARVGIAPMHSELRLLGVTAARRHLTLRAPAAGRVTGLALNIGDRVRRGQVVARILNRETEAARAGLETARRLDPEHAAELSKSVGRYTRGEGIAVAAPEDAIVAQRLVSSGQIVADLDPLADLIDPRSIYVEAAVPIDSIHLLRAGMPATITSELAPGVAFQARVAALSPSFDPGSATSPARLEFTGTPRIDSAGAAVDVRVVTASVRDALVIPVPALFQDAERGGYYVFIAGADGVAHRTEVQTGIRSSELVQITRGLSAGQLVITSGGYALSDGLKVHPLIAQE